nr:ABC transporter substrate-binding protein [Clostridia bacterium]
MKRFLATVLALVLGLSLCAAPALAETKDELVVGLSGLRTAIDPVLANYNTVSSIGKHIFNTLVKYDTENRVVPEVATGWERPDELTWVFTVDVDSYQFHNGDPLTMDDVVFSIARCFDIPQAANYVAGIVDIGYEGNLLTIKTEAPNNKLLHDLTSLVIVSKKVITEAGENWAQTAVGTGPYKLVSFIPSNEVVVERY